MASPPFSLNITSPANTDIAANYPTLDRSDKDVIQSWLLIQGNVQGRNNAALLDIVGGAVNTGAAPTPAAGIAAMYYDSTKVLLEYRGDTATAIQLSVPVGVILDFAGATAPNGYLLCFGQAISRTTYAVLFGILGTTYGSGDGSTTFNIPDMRGYASFGKDNMGGTAANRITSGGSGITGTTLGATGGVETVTLSVNQMPTHNHGVNDPGHTHTYSNGVAASATTGGAAGGSAGGGAGTNINSATTGITLANSGSSAAHQNMPPAIILNKIMRVL